MILETISTTGYLAHDIGTIDEGKAIVQAMRDKGIHGLTAQIEDETTTVVASFDGKEWREHQ